MDSREGSVVPLSPKIRICQLRRQTACRSARPGGQRKVLKPFRSMFDPIRGRCCFFLYAQIAKVQEVTDQRMLPILRRSNWNHSCSRYAVSKDCADLPFRGNHSLTRGWYQLQWTQKSVEIVKKSTWVSCHARGSFGSGTFFLRYLYLVQPPNLS